MQCKDGSFTNENFLTVIKSSHLVEELEAVKEITEQNIAKWRSQDTGGADGKTLTRTLTVCRGIFRAST